jgi:hypothetical protein
LPLAETISLNDDVDPYLQCEPMFIVISSRIEGVELEVMAPRNDCYYRGPIEPHPLGSYIANDV